MKEDRYTAEKLAEMATADLRQLLSNAQRLQAFDLARRCEEELNRRPAPRKARTSLPQTHAEGDFVSEYHFVCSSDRGVTLNDDGTFWSGSWVVAEGNVERSLRYGAVLALHESKAEPSYRQGTIIAYRLADRGMIEKQDSGIEFCVRPAQHRIAWSGNGAGEKGYHWSKISAD